MAEQTSNLCGGVTQVVIEQRYPKGWMIRGEKETGYAQALTERAESYQAHAIAREWCRTKGFETYRVSLFTDKPYIFRIQTVEARTGKVREEHEEDYSGECDLLQQYEQALKDIEARCLASPNGELHLHRPEGPFKLKTSKTNVFPTRLWALFTERDDIIGLAVEEVFGEAMDDYPDILTWLDQFQEESGGEQEKGDATDESKSI